MFFNEFLIELASEFCTSRITEATTLQYKNLEFLHGRPKKGTFVENPQKHFFKVNLRNQKNWQRRVKNGDQQLNGE